MRKISPQDVFMAVAPVVLDVIRPLTSPQRGEGRRLEVQGFKYECFYRLVDRTFRDMKSQISKTASNQQLQPTDAEKYDRAVAKFLRTLSRNLDGNTLQDIEGKTFKEEDLGSDFGIISDEKFRKVRCLYSCKVFIDTLSNPSNFNKFKNVRLLLNGVIQQKHQLSLLRRLERMKKVFESFYGSSGEDADTSASGGSIGPLPNAPLSSYASNMPSIAPMTPPQSPRVGDHSTPQLIDIRMWNDEASEVTKSHLEEIFKGIKQRCRKCKRRKTNSGSNALVACIADAIAVNLLLDGSWSERVKPELQFEVIFLGRENDKKAIQHQPTIVSVIDSIEGESGIDEACCLRFDPSLHHQLSTTNGKLLRIANKQNNAQSKTGIIWSNATEHSLAHVLQVYELDYLEKLRLLLTISRALLDLVGTQWLQTDWGISNIRVYKWQSNNSSYLNIRDPFLSLKPIHIDQRRSKRNGKDVSEYHHYPVAVSLGIVIMQVLLGEKLFPQSDRISRATTNFPLWLHEDIKGEPSRKLSQAARLQRVCWTRFGKLTPPLANHPIATQLKTRY
ncbi:hypothetical protein F4823DRAFT_636859 [Ustulina deusta]|nr:hypothetical protein F4823DRAFT_636859 [Ustulina deusta]